MDKIQEQTHQELVEIVKKLKQDSWKYEKSKHLKDFDQT